MTICLVIWDFRLFRLFVYKTWHVRSQATDKVIRILQ